MTSTLVSVNQLQCIRQGQTVFANISFALHAGEALMIEGPNGAGKSSLLRLLAGMATPASGEIHWRGQSIHETCTVFREEVHYIGHSNGIKLGLSVLENIALAGRLSVEEITDPSQHDPMLKLLQLNHHTHVLAKHLSAGQRRRLALARLFLFKKTLWLLDEPLTALDIVTQRIFLDLLDKHLLEGGIVIASSHHPIEIKRPAHTLRLPAC